MEMAAELSRPSRNSLSWLQVNALIYAMQIKPGAAQVKHKLSVRKRREWLEMNRFDLLDYHLTSPRKICVLNTFFRKKEIITIIIIIRLTFYIHIYY